MLQAYPRLDFEFLSTLAAVILDGWERLASVGFVGAAGREGPRLSELHRVRLVAALSFCGSNELGACDHTSV